MLSYIYIHAFSLRLNFYSVCFKFSYSPSLPQLLFPPLTPSLSVLIFHYVHTYLPLSSTQFFILSISALFPPSLSLSLSLSQTLPVSVSVNGWVRAFLLLEQIAYLWERGSPKFSLTFFPLH